MTTIGGAARKLVVVLTATFVVAYTPARAAQGDFASPDAFLKSTLTGADELSLGARGDLNGDGLEDWAGVIHRRKLTPAAATQLYVLLRLPGGGYRVAERSKEAPVAGAGCCWVESLEIRRSSVYIQNNAKSGGGMEAATHQFKLHGGEWRLVGVTIYRTDLDADATADTDVNLLTGAVIERRRKGRDRPTVKRSRKRFATSLLRDFDFYNGFGLE